MIDPTRLELAELLRGRMISPDPDENVDAVLELLEGLEDDVVSNHYGRNPA